MVRHIALLASLALNANCTFGDNLSPVTGWRTAPVCVSVSSGDINLFRVEDASWQPRLSRSEWLAFKLPAGSRFLLTFACSKSDSPVYAVLERSVNSTNGRDGDWETANVRIAGGRLDKFEFNRGSADWWRLRFTFRAATEPSPFELTDIGLYSLDKPDRKDYWLTVGASIQAQSIRNSTFKSMVKERFPGYEPVMFNLAVGGWRTHHLLAILPKFLADHPDAAYVCIHIGGNNVTPNRPYPGGAEQLREELTEILTMIRDSGKIPILSRLSYRAYKGDKPVPPEENGSGPYVTSVYDPLIREYCPHFFDSETGRGVVDAYTWFKENQDELSPDGIHVNPKGAESWNRLWAERAGGVIYARD